MSIANGIVGNTREATPGQARASGDRVYVASPLGFSVPTRYYYENEFLPCLRAAGHEPLDPWEDEDGALAGALGTGEAHPDQFSRRGALAKVDAALGARNVGLIEMADAVVAILDGPDVDSGTAAEIGFAFARQKPIIGLRTDFRESGENGGCIVNLQVEYFIRASGGTITRNLDDAVVALNRALRGKKGAVRAE